MRRLACLPLFLAAACNMADARADTRNGGTLSGTTATRGFPASGFDRVTLQGSDDVAVRAGHGFDVRATADTAVLDALDIAVSDHTLTIRRKPGSGSFGGRGHARIAVTLPALAGVAVAGSGDMTVGPVRRAAFTATMTGSGDLALPALAVETVALSVAGSGRLTAGGQARTGRYSVTGSGRLTATALAADTVSVSVAGSGTADAAARRTAEVAMIGSGDIAITGGAKCTVSRVGSGNVRCG